MAKSVKVKLMCFVLGVGFSCSITLFAFTKMPVSRSTHPATVCSTNCSSVGETRKNSMVRAMKTVMPTYLNIFNATTESKHVQVSVAEHQCIPYRTRSGETAICVYPRERDVWVSGNLLRSGHWEGDLVDITANALATQSGMSFLDIGCNIGTFTVYMAKMGKRVVGVDANKENLLLLSRSLSLGKLHQNVTLILNAMSDRHENVALRKVPNNQGGRNVIPSIPSNPGAVLTIMLDELAFMFTGQSVFIKMDIEGSEWRTLNGGQQFFKKVDVRFVLMEFAFHTKRHSGKQICDFLTENGFRPYRTNSITRGELNIAQYKSWPGNVLWIKL